MTLLEKKISFVLKRLKGFEGSLGTLHIDSGKNRVTYYSQRYRLRTNKGNVFVIQWAKGGAASFNTVTCSNKMVAMVLDTIDKSDIPQLAEALWRHAATDPNNIGNLDRILDKPIMSAISN